MTRKKVGSKENPISLFSIDLFPFDAWLVDIYDCVDHCVLWVMWASPLSVCCVCNIDGLVDKTLMDYTIIARNTRPRERERERLGAASSPVSSFRNPRDEQSVIIMTSIHPYDVNLVYIHKLVLLEKLYSIRFFAFILFFSIFNQIWFSPLSASRPALCGSR